MDLGSCPHDLDYTYYCDLLLSVDVVIVVHFGVPVVMTAGRALVAYLPLSLIVAKILEVGVEHDSNGLHALKLSLQ
jgi:hypothetical protein